MSLGMGEILLIIAVVVILFGGKKIPELMKALARASHEFKKAKQSIEAETIEIKKAVETEAKEIEGKDTGGR